MGASVSSLTGKSTTHAPHAQGSAAGAGPGAQAARRVEGGSWLARKSYVAMVPLKPFAPPQRPGRRAGLSRDLPPICVDAPVASPKKVLLRCFVASEERYSWSGGGRHLLSSCLHLQRTHPCELLLVVGEAPAQRRRVERKVLFFEARRTGLVERAESQQPLVRRGRPIVALADLGAGALLGDQLHRGQEEVHAKGAGRRRWRPPGRAWPGCRSARSRPRGAPRSSSSARRKQESFFSLGRLRVKVIRSSPHQAARCALMNSPPLSQVCLLYT